MFGVLIVVSAQITVAWDVTSGSLKDRPRASWSFFPSSRVRWPRS